MSCSPSSYISSSLELRRAKSHFASREASSPPQFNLTQCREPICLTAAAPVHPFIAWISQGSNDYSLAWLAEVGAIVPHPPTSPDPVLSRTSVVWKPYWQLQRAVTIARDHQGTFVDSHFTPFNTLVSSNTRAACIVLNARSTDFEKADSAWKPLGFFYLFRQQRLTPSALFESIRQQYLDDIITTGVTSLKFARDLQNDTRHARVFFTPLLQGAQDAIESGRAPSGEACGDDCFNTWAPFVQQLKHIRLYLDFVDVNAFAAQHRISAIVAGTSTLRRQLRASAEVQPKEYQRAKTTLQMKALLDTAKQSICPPRAGIASFASRAALLASKQWAFRHLDHITDLLNKTCPTPLPMAVCWHRQQWTPTQQPPSPTGLQKPLGAYPEHSLGPVPNPNLLAAESIFDSWRSQPLPFPTPTLNSNFHDWYALWNGRAELTWREDFEARDTKTEKPPLNDRMRDDWRKYKRRLNSETCMVVAEYVQSAEHALETLEDMKVLLRRAEFAGHLLPEYHTDHASYEVGAAGIYHPDDDEEKDLVRSIQDAVWCIDAEALETSHLRPQSLHHQKIRRPHTCRMASTKMKAAVLSEWVENQKRRIAAREFVHPGWEQEDDGVSK